MPCTFPTDHDRAHDYSGLVAEGGGERNFRGIVQVRGEDPYADLGYTTPRPWVKER